MHRLSPQPHRREVTHHVNAYPIRATYHGEMDQPSAVWLFVHGMVESDEVWLPVLAAIPSGIQVITLELPWCGKYDALWGLKMAPEEWIRAALDVHRIAPNGIVAHSFGANAVLQYLEKYGCPGLDGLALVSPFFKATTEEISWDLFQRYVSEFERFIGLSLSVRQTGRQLSPEMFAVIRQKLRDQFGCYSWMQFWQLFGRTPFLKLQHLTMPCLVVTGADDFSSPEADVAALVARLPYAKLVVHQECSHFCLTTRESDTVELLTDFMRCGFLSTSNQRSIKLFSHATSNSVSNSVSNSTSNTASNTTNQEHTQCLQ